MSLRSEVKEAMARELEKWNYGTTAAAIRSENWEARDCAVSYRRVAQAALSVIDQWEEVEAFACTSWPEVAYLHIGESQYGYRSPRTILMRKQEPEPDPLAELKELGLQLCEAVEDLPDMEEAQRAVAAFKNAAMR